MIVSKRALVERIHEPQGIARVYDGVLKGDFDVDAVLDAYYLTLSRFKSFFY
jgi:hypothetical protein